MAKANPVTYVEIGQAIHLVTKGFSPARFNKAINELYSLIKESKYKTFKTAVYKTVELIASETGDNFSEEEKLTLWNRFKKRLSRENMPAKEKAEKDSEEGTEGTEGTEGSADRTSSILELIPDGYQVLRKKDLVSIIDSIVEVLTQ